VVLEKRIKNIAGRPDLKLEKDKMTKKPGKIMFAALLMLLIFPVATVYAGHIFKIGRDVNIAEGERVESVLTVGGQITVSGLVENNVVAVGGPVVLTGSAVVRGNVFCVGGVVVRGNGSLVYGKVTEVNASDVVPALSSVFYADTDEWSWLADIIYFCFFALLFTVALLFAFLFPRPLNAIIVSIRGNMTGAFFRGILGTLLVAPFFMLLILSVVGIPLIPLVFSVLLLAFMFGFIAVSALLGRFILTKTFRHHKESLVRETLLGLMLWWIIGWAPFYVGTVVKAAVVTVGFGGVLLAVFHGGNKTRIPA